VEGFKKASFLKKILPDTLLDNQSIIFKIGVVMKMCGWRFFSKPAGLELAFLNTRNLALQSFLSLFYFAKFSGLSLERV